MVQVKQFKGTHGKARKDGPPPNYIRGILVRYKDVFTNVLLEKLLPKSEKDFCLMRD